MLMGHAEGLQKLSSSKDLLLADPVSEAELNGGDEEGETCEQIVHMASFGELAVKIVQYDTIIWLSISALLILAWGIGIIMLLYLPVRRSVLRKDVSSRKLFVTPSEIVYKVSRPSFFPFWGVTKIEKRVPLSLVIDVIIEQGCLQSVYGIHTFRIESIPRGRATPIDELRLQGIYNPGHLRKIIVTEASKAIQDVGRSWKPTNVHSIAGESVACMESSSATPSVFRSPSKSWKMAGSPHDASVEHRRVVPTDLLLHKLEEVNKSVMKIELLIEKSEPPSKSME